MRFRCIIKNVRTTFNSESLTFESGNHSLLRSFGETHGYHKALFFSFFLKNLVKFSSSVVKLVPVKHLYLSWFMCLAPQQATKTATSNKKYCRKLFAAPWTWCVCLSTKKHNFVMCLLVFLAEHFFPIIRVSFVKTSTPLVQRSHSQLQRTVSTTTCPDY